MIYRIIILFFFSFKRVQRYSFRKEPVSGNLLYINITLSWLPILKVLSLLSLRNKTTLNNLLFFFKFLRDFVDYFDVLKCIFI